MARRFVPLALVSVAAVWSAWLGFRVQTMGDYPRDFAPAMNALLSGHLGAYFGHLPDDSAGGSVLLRAPGALIGKLLDGGQLAIFRGGALLSMLALGALALWLARRMREAGRPLVARAGAVAACMLAPAVLDAVFFGHPEEPLGAALCVTALLLADVDRPVLSGVALGLAIIDKPWAVLAIAPVLLAARRRPVAVCTSAGAVCAVWFGLAFALAPAHGAQLLGLVLVAHPQEVWWPFAHLHAAPGVTPAYFLPALISDHAREVVVLLSIPLALPLARRRDRSANDCIALMALLFLLRCALDPSDHVYYHVPFVIALAAWEARTGRLPLLTMTAIGGLWLVFHPLAAVAAPNVQFLTYMALTLPLVALMASVSCARNDRHRRRQRIPQRAEACT
jgi:hypothetical protein